MFYKNLTYYFHFNVFYKTVLTLHCHFNSLSTKSEEERLNKPSQAAIFWRSRCAAAAVWAPPTTLQIWLLPPLLTQMGEIKWCGSEMRIFHSNCRIWFQHNNHLFDHNKKYNIYYIDFITFCFYALFILFLSQLINNYNADNMNHIFHFFCIIFSRNFFSCFIFWFVYAVYINHCS